MEKGMEKACHAKRQHGIRLYDIHKCSGTTATACAARPQHPAECMTNSRLAGDLRGCLAAWLFAMLATSRKAQWKEEVSLQGG